MPFIYELQLIIQESHKDKIRLIHYSCGCPSRTSIIINTKMMHILHLDI